MDNKFVTKSNTTPYSAHTPLHALHKYVNIKLPVHYV